MRSCEKPVEKEKRGREKANGKPRKIIFNDAELSFR